MISSGATREKQNHPMYYSKLSNFPDAIPSPYEKQIELDLKRTFPSDEYFQKPETLQSLKNVLLAYSRRNITIGYYQGFNFIAGLLLKTLENEEDTFWVFTQLIEEILPINYFSELVGVIVDTSILHILFKIQFKEMYEFLAEMNFEESLSNLLYKWLITMFISNLHNDLCMVILDSLFLQGSISLFYTTFGVFEMVKYEVFNCKEFEDLYFLFEQRLIEFNYPQYIIFYCIIKDYEFNYDFLNQKRLEYTPPVVEGIIEKNNERIEKLKKTSNKKNNRVSFVGEEQFHCQKDWPICIYDLTYKYDTLFNFLVLQIGEKINIIENYFFSECFKKN